MAKSNKSRRFCMERLEDRQMMAGDFSATVNTEGTLVILEAGNSIGGAQAVEVSQLPNGKIRVSGATSPANPAGSIVRNLAGNNIGTPEFSGVKNILINVGDGPDQVVVQGSTLNLGQFGSVTIDAKGSPSSTSDNDNVFVTNLKVNRQLDIRTGAGQDRVKVVKSDVLLAGFGVPRFNIDAGVLSAAGDADKDEVIVDGVKAQGEVSLLTGASADALTVKNADFNYLFGTQQFGGTTINSGAGADVVNIGSNGVEFGFVAVRGNMVLDAGSDSQNDADIVRVEDLDALLSLSLSLGGGDDRLDMIDATVRKDMILAAMSGNDAVVMNQVHVFDNLFAEMGDGDDTLDMIGVRALKVEADGAGGANDQLFTFDMSNVTIVKKGFERINGKPIAPKRGAPGSLNLPTIELEPSK